MTDVRLTALNPVDSQVYPVACNTSGELIVEQVDPGPDLSITGNLTVGGSGTFDGSGSVKGGLNLGNPGIANAVINSADGVFINIDSDDTASNDTFQVRHNGTGAGAGDLLMLISENGSAQFVGGITANGNVHEFGVYTSTSTTASGIEIDNGSLTTQRALSSGVTGRAIAHRFGTNITFEVSNNGSVETQGDITCTDNSKGLVLKSPNGTLYRLSVADNGTLSASIA